MKPTTEQIENFRALLNDMIVRHQEGTKLPENCRETIGLEFGKRYARIVRKRGELSCSAYGFVDLENGDLLKAASWKAPAKHARGSVFNANPLDGCGPYGMDYLR
jgi:hypothetical protein